ncbi:MAG: hypothetical protein Q9186_007121 [Xanthomendoza sp. 1 TL-2023]
MAVSPPTLTSDGDMRVPSQSVTATIESNTTAIKYMFIFIAIFLFLGLAVAFISPRRCRTVVRWCASYRPITWCENLLSRIGGTCGHSHLPTYYVPASDDEEEGIPMHPLYNESNWARRADREPSLSGRTLAPEERVAEGVANVTRPPGSMDIVSMRDQELSRTRSEREAEARENVDVAARGVVPETESRRAHKREGTDGR